ncbi:MAG: hypothetical protein ACFFC7_08950 [Candidatus Hermodarchaeota archaeon]
MHILNGGLGLFLQTPTLAIFSQVIITLIILSIGVIFVIGLLILYWLISKEKDEKELKMSQVDRWDKFSSRKQPLRVIKSDRDPLQPVKRDLNIYEEHSRNPFFSQRERKNSPKVRASQAFFSKKKTPTIQPVDKTLRDICYICKNLLKSGEFAYVCPFCKTATHKNHLEAWLADRSICPYCRAPLTIQSLRPVKFVARKECWACRHQYQAEINICPNCGRPSKCLICQKDVIAGDPFLVCPQCFSAYHQACGVATFSTNNSCLNCDHKLNLEDLSPTDELSIKVIKIPKSIVKQTLGRTKIASEGDLQRILAKHPSLIEPGMKLIRKQEEFESAGISWANIIDLWLQDANGRDVFVELKRDPLSRASGHVLLGQLVKYLFVGIQDGIKEGKYAGVRTLVITGGYRRTEIALSLHRLGVEICKYVIVY